MRMPRPSGGLRPGRRRRRRAVAASIGGVVLSGCGADFAESSPREIEQAAKESLAGLDSVHLLGEVTNGGQQLQLDLALDTAGACTGSIALGDSGAAEIRGAGDGAYYMKPDEQFWTTFAGSSAGQVMALVGDRWVEVPPEAGDFAEFCDLDALLAEVEGSEDSENLAVDGVEEVDGRATVVLRTTTEGGDPQTLYVATEEPHHPLRIVVTEGDEPGQFTLSDFDVPVEVTTPSGDEVVDLAELTGPAG